jgi:putative ABC transport system permease protein
VTTLVGVIFGLAPALQAARRDIHTGLRESGRRATGRHRARRALVVSEVAFALMLLTGSGLLLRSMERVLSVSPGFDPDRALTLQVVTGGPRFATDTATWAFFDQALAAARAVPGVEAAGFTSQLPLSGESDRSGVHIETHPRPNPEDDPSAHRYAVSPGYLEAMRMPVLRGRTLTEADRRGQPLVVLVSESFARREWPGEDPIGQRVRVAGASDPPWRTVVGIVGDVTQVSLAMQPPNAVYLPEDQWNWADYAMSLVVRARGEPTALVPALRRAIWAVDPDQPIVRITTLSRLVAASAAQRRFTLVLFEAFAATALALAAAGIYGVLSETVVERRRELGVRAALGASRSGILLMTVRQGLGLTLIGTVLGLGAAAVLTRLIQGLLFRVAPLDPATYAGVATLLLAVAVAACWAPAWRAARVDPAEVLRAE